MVNSFLWRSSCSIFYHWVLSVLNNIEELYNLSLIVNSTETHGFKIGLFYLLTQGMREEISPFMRKGQVGDSVNYFTDELEKELNSMLKEKLENTGLDFCTS